MCTRARVPESDMSQLAQTRAETAERGGRQSKQEQATSPTPQATKTPGTVLEDNKRNVYQHLERGDVSAFGRLQLYSFRSGDAARLPCITLSAFAIFSPWWRGGDRHTTCHISLLPSRDILIRISYTMLLHLLRTML
jgi:hypothetical protein